MDIFLWYTGGFTIRQSMSCVTGFVGKKRPFRRFPVDMSGFAFSVGLLHLKKPEMPFKATFEEEGFLRSMQLR